MAKRSATGIAPPEGGALLVDKPQGPTSHDVINRLRRTLQAQRVGHAGTLDPLATGLLIVAVGPATRLLHYLSGIDKEYEGEITLGATSTTFDAEGKITPRALGGGWPAREAVEQAIERLTGMIEQRPPRFSAIKVKGRPLYDYARKGEDQEAPMRRVRVDAFDLVEYGPPRLRFRCRVSSGAYVRSLAHDLGEIMGCGAYLSALRRTVAGPFHVEDARTLAELQLRPESALASLMRPAQAVRHFSRIEVDAYGVQRLLNGGGVPPSMVRRQCQGSSAGPVAALDSSGRLLALCRFEFSEDLFKPLRVFGPENNA